MELVTDRERLVAALRERGVDWLAPSEAEGEPLVDELLIASLAVQDDPRLRVALTGLFVLKPELALQVAEAMSMLDSGAHRELMARYMTAVYLQRRWRTRLGFYQAEFLELPDLYSAVLELPEADTGYGKPGLHALADWHEQHTPGAYNHLAEYERVIEHVFASLKLRVQADERAFAG